MDPVYPVPEHMVCHVDHLDLIAQFACIEGNDTGKKAPLVISMGGKHQNVRLALHQGPLLYPVGIIAFGKGVQLADGGILGHLQIDPVRGLFQIIALVQKHLVFHRPVVFAVGAQIPLIGHVVPQDIQTAEGGLCADLHRGVRHDRLHIIL